MRFLALTLLLLIAGPAASDEPATAAHATRVVAAAGGEAKLLKLFRIKERLVLGSDPEKKGSERVSVLEPPTHWWVGTRERVSADKEPAVFLVWAWTLAPLCDPKTKLEPLPDTKDGDTPVFGLRASGTVTPPMDLYFETATDRLVRVDWRKDTHRFSAWKEHDGFKYASKVAGYKADGKAWYFTEVLSVERLTELPAGLTR